MKFFKSTRVLGELEMEVMEILWERHPASVRDILTVLDVRKKIAYTTVMTVMARLHEKGLLKRKLGTDGAYTYTPTQTKAAFLKTQSRRFISGLLREFGDVAVAQFIDILEESNDKNLKTWKKKLKKIR